MNGEARIDVWTPGVNGFGGGITKLSQELVRALRDQVGRVFGKHDVGGTWAGCRHIGAGSWPGSMRTPVFAAQLFSAGLISPPAAIVSSHINFGPVAHRIGQLRHVPYWLVAHGIDVVPELSRSRRAALQYATGIIAVSRWTRERVLNLGSIAADKVFVLPNTVDDRLFDIKSDRSMRARFGIANDAKVILTVARLSAKEGYKGCDYVMRSLPRLRRELGSVHYVIVGSGDDMPRLQRLAGDLGVAKSVVFAGFVDEDQLPRYYAMSDAFAMPSRGEGFGIVFLEAMACGVPVLAGNQDGSVDALFDGEFGVLVDPTSQIDISRGLIQLLTRQGPRWWYEPHELRARMLERFGRDRFRETLAAIIDPATLTKPQSSNRTFKPPVKLIGCP